MLSTRMLWAPEARGSEYSKVLLRSAISSGRVGEGYFPLETYKDADGSIALTIYLDRGYVEVPEELVAACVNSDPRNDSQRADPIFCTQRIALEVAAQHGDHDFVQTVLSSPNPAFVKALLASNPPDADGRCDFGNALLLAVKNGHARTVEVLLAAGVDLEKTSRSGDTALVVAAMRNQATIVDLLVSAGAKVNAAGPSGNTALTFAVMGGYAGVVRKLLDSGAEIGRTELVQAACRGYAGIEDMLLAAHGTLSDCSGCTASVAHSLQCRRYGTSFRVDDAQGGDTALLTAVRNGLADVAEMLLDAGANIEQVDRNGFSPLRIAVKQGDLDIVVRLISRHASVHHTTKAGDTALMLASVSEHYCIVDVLLAVGASADRGSLLRAIKNGHTPVVNAMLAAGAPADTSEHLDGARPIVIAASRGDTEIVDMLLAAGANVDSADAGGLTALIAAAARGNVTMIERLLAAGADIRITARRGMRAIAFAAKGGHLPAVEKLLYAAKQTNSFTAATSFALVHAAWGGHLEIVDLLLAAGVTVNQTEHFGRSALMTAVECGDGDMVDRLLAAGAADRNPKLLIIAAERGYEDVVDKLLAADVSPQLPSRTCGRRSALYRAVANGHVAIVKKLLASGAPFDRASGEQISVFLKACKTGRVDVVEVLLDTGGLFAQSNTRPSIRRWHDLYALPIHIAAERDDIELLELLMSKGADANAPRWGRSPLYSASCKGALSAVGFLLAHGHMPSDTHDKDYALYDAARAGHTAIARELLAHGGALNYASWWCNTQRYYVEVLNDRSDW